MVGSISGSSYPSLPIGSYGQNAQEMTSCASDLSTKSLDLANQLEQFCRHPQTISDDDAVGQCAQTIRSITETLQQSTQALGKSPFPIQTRSV